MGVVVIQPNAQVGDKQVEIDTRTKRERRRLKNILRNKKAEGAAIFAEVSGDNYRVEDYDTSTDELIIRADRPKSRRKRIPAANAKLRVVAPTAGG